MWSGGRRKREWGGGTKKRIKTNSKETVRLQECGRVLKSGSKHHLS